MAYTINLTDGTIFATIADGTINTSAQPVLTLVGKNYAGYGEFLDENFIRLLENGSNTTPPGAPLTGQLWWDSTNSLMKVYNGTTFKTISSATASASQPTSNVTGDLWWDTTNQQLKAYNGASFVLVGPASSAGQGTSGAIVDTVTDNVAVDHVVIKMYVNNSIVAIVSKDATFTPQVAITGFATIGPGIQLSSTVSNAVFNGNASNALLLDGVAASGFLSSTSNDSTTGTLGILNDTGLTVGADQDLKLSVVTANAEVQIANQTSNANIAFRVNIAGTATTVMTINGSTGAISGNQINANYADVAERFAADYEYSPGTVVELGGSAEITQSVEELSENVFGVISTRAAYLMNSNAGTDLTHPPIAMTGRVPVQVIGSIRKGDRLVAAGNGMARAAKPGEATAFNVIGRALHSKDDEATGTIEAIVNIN
jgi:hypothetical protein